MHGRQERLDELVSAVRDDPELLAVLLYGSAARGEATPASDLDVALVLEPGLEPDGSTDPSRKRIRYGGRFGMDVTIFRQLPLYVRCRALREGRVLYVRDEDRLYELAIRTAREFEHFRPLYRSYLEQVARAGS